MKTTWWAVSGHAVREHGVVPLAVVLVEAVRAAGTVGHVHASVASSTVGVTGSAAGVNVHVEGAVAFLTIGGLGSGAAYAVLVAQLADAGLVVAEDLVVLVVSDFTIGLACQVTRREVVVLFAVSTDVVLALFAVVGTALAGQ